MDKEKRTITPETFREMVTGFQTSRIILTAYELGIFTLLGDDSKSSEDAAKSLGTDRRGTDRLMNALTALGLMKKKNALFSNIEFAAKFLVKGKPGYMAGLMHSVNLWDTWDTLTGAVKKGTSIKEDGVEERGDGWLNSFISAMHDRAKNQSQAVAGLLDFSGVKKILDVGGGSGAFSMAFVKKNGGIKAVIFDLPGVIPITKRYVNESGLSDSFEYKAGDYNLDDFGKGYDMVFLSAIVHINSYNENMKLIKKCGDSLNRGGYVAVQDFIMDNDRINPPFGAIFALNMLVGTKTGDTYTETEVYEWMKNAGLADLKRIDTEFGTSIITGKKI